MARPIHADAQATRRRVLGAASSLFSEKGLASTTMREIAANAGVSMATVHHYYGGKNDLYEACVSAMYDELRTLQTDVERSIVGVTDFSGVIDAAVRQIYLFARKHRDAVRLMNRTVLDTGRLDEKRHEQFLQPFLERGGTMVGALVGKPPEQMRLVLLALNYLIARFVLNSDAELARLTGDATEQEAVDRVANFLVGAAHDLTGVPRAAPQTQPQTQTQAEGS